MRLLLTIAYQNLLLPEDADTDAILRALSGSVYVKEERASYSEPAVYVKENANVDFAPRFVSDECVQETGALASGVIETLKKKNSALHKEKHEVQQKLAELEKKVSALVGEEEA